MSAIRWQRVDDLIDASPSLADLRTHGLQLFAARRWRAMGRPLPGDLAHEEMQATWRTLTAPRVLEAVRAACEGPILLVKGPAAAARYPDPLVRPFVDLDLLVSDAQATQAALLDSGFQLSCDPGGYPEDLHHLPPIHSPDYPIPLEVHSRLKWVEGLNAPTFETLAAAAEPSALGVNGILMLPPAHHTLVLAGHLWAHDPLARLLRLLDIAVMSDACDCDELESLARRWGISRLWSSTATITESLFGTDDRDAWPLRTWARGLRSAREPTVWELHLSRVLSPLAIHTPVAAVRALGAAVAGFALPQDGEPWRRKITRTGQQIGRPAMRRSEHLKALETDDPAQRD